MRSLKLILHQFRYELLEFGQNPQSRFFMLALPVMLLAIFIGILGDHPTLGDDGIAKLRTYYVPSMLAFGVVWASVVNLAVTVTVSRERGVLKRRRAAPVPPWAFIVARALTAIMLSLLVVTVLLAFGGLVYGITVPAEKLPAVALGVIVGSGSFCCLGYALVSFIRSEDGALPVTLGVVLPLYFISGVFIEWAEVPHLLRNIAEAFPIRHLGAALLLPFDSNASGAAVAGRDLLVVAVWGLGGLALALWRFSWEPRGV
jgi:ABC-2 type transport system permease protein